MIPYVIGAVPLRHDPPLGPNTQADPAGFYVDMPIGAKVVSVTESDGKLALMVLAPVKAGVLAKHRLLVVPTTGQAVELPIGAVPGQFLGGWQNLAVFTNGEWPTKAAAVLQ